MSELQLTTYQALPDLSKYKANPVNLEAQYWTPEKANEKKNAVFMGILENCELPSFDDPSVKIRKDAAYFTELVPVLDEKGEVKSKDGKIEYKAQIFRCAQSRLVSTFRTQTPGNVFEIVYVGKEKNKTNNFSSDKFEIYQMLPENE